MFTVSKSASILFRLWIINRCDHIYEMWATHTAVTFKTSSSFKVNVKNQCDQLEPFTNSAWGNLWAPHNSWSLGFLLKWLNFTNSPNTSICDRRFTVECACTLQGCQSHSWCTSVLKSFDLNCLNTLSSKFLVIWNDLISWFRSLIRIEGKPEVSSSGPWGPMLLKVNLS